MFCLGSLKNRILKRRIGNIFKRTYPINLIIFSPLKLSYLRFLMESQSPRKIKFRLALYLPNNIVTVVRTSKTNFHILQLDRWNRYSDT